MIDPGLDLAIAALLLVPFTRNVAIGATEVINLIPTLALIIALLISIAVIKVMVALELQA